MSEYQLELKQVVAYPRCRIYRQFIRTLMADRSIRVSGGSGLFYFTVLCSYANFRTSYRSLGGINYTIRPGEWVCRIGNLTSWFRVRFRHQVLSILDRLQSMHLITYSLLGKGAVVKFRVTGWHRHNTVLEYNAPCQKDTGFFFLPVSVASELVSTGRCSEADIILDLWLNTVYNDPQVQGSATGPVVYLRNGTGNPLLDYASLAIRWGVGKSTVGRILKKLAEQNYLSLVTFPGRRGSVIYLNSYLSTMFQISDVMIDKAEVAMALNIKLSFDDSGDTCIADEQISVSKELVCVPKPHIRHIISKVVETVAAQGVSCCDCPKTVYMLSTLYDCTESSIWDGGSLLLTMTCGSRELFQFELKMSEQSEGGIDNEAR